MLAPVVWNLENFNYILNVFCNKIISNKCLLWQFRSHGLCLVKEEHPTGTNAKLGYEQIDLFIWFQTNNRTFNDLQRP